MSGRVVLFPIRAAGRCSVLRRVLVCRRGQGVDFAAVPAKLDALEGLRLHYQARGMPTDWVYDLRARVVNGTL